MQAHCPDLGYKFIWGGCREDSVWHHREYEDECNMISPDLIDLKVLALQQVVFF